MVLKERLARFVIVAKASDRLRISSRPAAVLIFISSQQWLFEPRWDGWRAICFVRDAFKLPDEGCGWKRTPIRLHSNVGLTIFGINDSDTKTPAVVIVIVVVDH